MKSSDKIRLILPDGRVLILTKMCAVMKNDDGDWVSLLYGEYTPMEMVMSAMMSAEIYEMASEDMAEDSDHTDSSTDASSTPVADWIKVAVFKEDGDMRDWKVDEIDKSD